MNAGPEHETFALVKINGPGLDEISPGNQFFIKTSLRFIHR
jgi:hypothetical protein